VQCFLRTEAYVIRGKKKPGGQIYLTSLKNWLNPTSNENTIIEANVTRERFAIDDDDDNEAYSTSLV